MGGGDSLDKFMSRTGSSRGVTKQNGEIIAVPHPTMKKSYADNAAGGSEVANSTMRGSFTDPRRKAPLMKYHPNALRNRLPVEFKDAAIPAVRFCHPRNDHTYDIFSGNKEVRAAPLRWLLCGGWWWWWLVAVVVARAPAHPRWRHDVIHNPCTCTYALAPIAHMGPPSLAVPALCARAGWLPALPHDGAELLRVLPGAGGRIQPGHRLRDGQGHPQEAEHVDLFPSRALLAAGRHARSGVDAPTRACSAFH